MTLFGPANTLLSSYAESIWLYIICICIDTMITALVLHEFGKCYPVGWCLTSGEDQKVVSLLLKIELALLHLDG